MNFVILLYLNLDLVGRCLVAVVPVAYAWWRSDVNRIRKSKSLWGLRDPEPDDEFLIASQSNTNAFFTMCALPLVSYFILGIVPAIITGIGCLTLFIRTARYLGQMK